MVSVFALQEFILYVIVSHIVPPQTTCFFATAIAKALPNAKLYCVSQRPIHKQPEIKDRAIVLDYRGDEFDVPELNEDFRMLSFKGCVCVCVCVCECVCVCVCVCNVRRLQCPPGCMFNPLPPSFLPFAFGLP